MEYNPHAVSTVDWAEMRMRSVGLRMRKAVGDAERDAVLADSNYCFESNAGPTNQELDAAVRKLPADIEPLFRAAMNRALIRAGRPELPPQF
jgi:hypothetical protein